MNTTDTVFQRALLSSPYAIQYALKSVASSNALLLRRMLGKSNGLWSFATDLTYI